jgi:hypothetical protein
MKIKTRKTHARRANAPAARPTVDYPMEGESLNSPSYTIRVSAPAALSVHVAIDQGAWLECRESCGYWWYDWTPEIGGEHELVACALFAGGREIVSDTVHCLKA